MCTPSRESNFMTMQGSVRARNLGVALSRHRVAYATMKCFAEIPEDCDLENGLLMFATAAEFSQVVLRRYTTQNLR